MRVFLERLLASKLRMENFLDQYGYLALLIGTFFEGETAILVASSLIYRGLFNFPLTVLVAFSGSFISDWIYFLIGRLNGKYFLANRPGLQARVEPVTKFFHKHQLQILISYRFLYGFRVIIPLIVGMSGLSPTRYLFYSTLTGLMWATLVATVGYWVGRFLNLEAKAFEDNFIFIVLGFALFGLTVGYIIRTLALKRMKAE